MNEDATRTSLSAGRILADGTILADRYRIERLLGVGGMGMVYLAHDQQLDLQVALKVLRSGGAEDEMRLERFRSELVLARQISHRNVVRIHDIGQSDDTYFITMDFVEGESLKHVLNLENTVELERALSIAADLADALAEAHRAGVVHRDVKPANVLIGSDRAYLTDFGIARSIDSDGLTRVGEVVGTLDYLSPEQARGGKIDGRTDIYALGLLLYEMLTGKRPFSGETAEEVLAQRTLASPKELTASIKTIPANIRPILTRCLAVDPADRYQDASQLSADLRAGKLSRHHRKTLATLAAASVLIALAFIGWAQWPWVTTPGTSDISAVAGAIPLGVLPFDVAIDSGDTDSISHGLSELLAEQLSSDATVRIVSTQRVNDTLRDLKLDASNLPASDRELLGDLLDAQLLVTGRLQQIGGSFHVEARLLRATTGDVLHRASVDVDSSGIFSAIEPLAAELLSNLNPSSSPSTDSLLVANSDALRNFATGIQSLTRGNALEAIEPLRAAVALEPRFALAWDRLAHALSILGRDREAIAAAESAVAALPANSGKAGTLVRARRDALAGEADRAMAELEALLEKQPDDSEVLFYLAEVYGDAGRLQDAESTLQKVVVASPDHPQAWYLLGKFAILQGNTQRAVDDYLVKALVIQNRLENDQGRADVLNAMGIGLAQLGDIDAASDYYRQSLELRRSIGDDRGVAAVLANMARVSLREGRYDEAREDLLAARDALIDIGDRWTVANLENELGYLEEQRGRFTTALDHYRESLRIRDDLGDLRALAESYNNVGYTYLLLGEYDNASIFIQRSLETYEKTGNLEGVMYASQTEGILNTARGRYDDALKALLTSLQTSRDLDDQHAEAATQGYIARVRFLQGEYDAAQSSFTSAIDSLRNLGDERGVAEFTLHSAEMSLALGMPEQTAQAIDTAETLLADDDSAAQKALLFRIKGDHRAALDDRAEAGKLYETAYNQAELSGDRVAILLARVSKAAAMNNSARIDELRDIRRDSVRLGHGWLSISSAIALGRALIDAGLFSECEQTVQQAMRSIQSGSYHGDFLLTALLAEALTALSRDNEANIAWLGAREKLDRARNAMSQPQRESFDKQPIATRITLATEG
ncbi:MAG: protein kinase [Woeseiaceae bacterium]|nr:protein kinase [Woeseiaceae bacterium]